VQHLKLSQLLAFITTFLSANLINPRDALEQPSLAAVHSGFYLTNFVTVNAL
jgi:hypothetical protein